VQFDVLIA